MNIFYLDEDPVLAAEMLGDKHVVKMALETAQILSTVVRTQFPDAEVYKATHRHHPCVLWAGESSANFQWLVRHGLAIADEYERRYGRVHKSADVILACAYSDLQFEAAEFTRPAQAMPAEYKAADSVTAYRQYYRAEKYAAGIAEYKKSRKAPCWLQP